MNAAQHRIARTLMLSLLCLVVWHGVANEPALAQRRPNPNGRPETPSQRWLPLPEGGSSDLKQQVQWLQQLKELMSLDTAGGEPPAIPKLDPEQMKALMNAMKELGGGLPNGASPSTPNGISPDQISKALADPGTRERMRQMLEQFSKDRKLPEGNGANDPSSVPFPRKSANGSSRSGEESPDQNPSAQNSSSTESGPDLATMSRRLQELLQQYEQQTGRKTNDSVPENGTTEIGPNAGTLNSPKPGGAQNSLSGSPPATDAGSKRADPTNLNDRGGEPNSRRGPSSFDRPSPSSGTPELGGNGSSQTGIRRSGAVPPAGEFPLGGVERRTPRLGPQPVTPRDTGAQPPSPASPPSLPSSTNPQQTERPGNMQTPGERIPLQPPSSLTTHPRTQSPTTPQDDARNSPSPTPPPGSPPSLNPRPDPIAPRTGTTRPSIDVQSELEQQGFAQTLRKIVEQAREESLADAAGSSNPSSGDRGTTGDGTSENGVTGNGSFGGLESSAMQALSGMLSNSVPGAGGSPVPPPSGQQSQPAAPSPASSFVPQSPVDPPRSSGQMLKAAGEFLSGIAVAPSPTPATSPTSRTASTGASSNPGGGDSRSTMGLLLLLAALGAVWFFAPGLLSAFDKARRAAESTACVVLRSSDIRSRSDVVVAFHQFALRPAMSAQSWWTHRRVERQIADAAPSLQPSIQTLTDLYEQARYLPDDAEFTPDQIGTARSALATCETANGAKQLG
jgi:hypothetical protein